VENFLEQLREYLHKRLLIGLRKSYGIVVTEFTISISRIPVKFDTPHIHIGMAQGQIVCS
jgi:hypothetical protein